jgi:hypothetical protein
VARLSARPAVVGAVVLAAGALLSGCSATNPITTSMAYAASDGVRTTLGELTAENLMLVAAAADGPAALQGALANNGDETLTVEISLGSTTERVRVGGHETVLIGGERGEDLVFTTPVGPGAIAEMTLATDAAGETTAPVPVLDGTLPEYADLVPEPEPTASPTADATEQPGAEATEPTETSETDEAAQGESDQPGGNTESAEG